MLRIRLFLAWLLLLALPLQGAAAAGMQVCSKVSHPDPLVALTATAMAAGTPHEVHQAQRHSHAGHGSSEPVHGAHASQQAHHAAADEAAPDAVAPATNGLADPGHACSVCAALCHGVGVMTAACTPPPALAPQVHAAEPVLRVASLPPSVPDKPPRA